MEMLEPWRLVLLFGVGLVSGFVNVLAGGGSFLTLPALIFLGLPPVTANGTNRIGILIQNVGATWAFRRRGVFPAGLAAVLSLPALAGAFLGARFAVEMGDEAFRRTLAVLMLAVTLLMIRGRAVRPGVFPESGLRGLGAARTAGLLGAFFGVGLYGGFVQAGVGFFVIAALSAAGLDLVRTNAVKLIVILVLTLPALAVFVSSGRVAWPVGLLLGLGNFLGAQLSVRMAVRRGHGWIRHVVTATVILMALRLLLF